MVSLVVLRHLYSKILQTIDPSTLSDEMICSHIYDSQNELCCCCCFCCLTSTILGNVLSELLIRQTAYEFISIVPYIMIAFFLCVHFGVEVLDYESKKQTPSFS